MADKNKNTYHHSSHSHDQEELEKIDISYLMDDAWRGFKKLWFVCLLITALLAAGNGYLAKRSYKPQYRAYATFAIKAYSVFEGNLSEYYSSVTAAQMAQTFPYILESSALRNKVSAALGAPFSEQIKVSNESDKISLITMSVTSPDPERAYEVLQAVIANYPQVAEPIIGATEMQIMDESGVPERPVNQRNLKDAMQKGGLFGLIISAVILALYALTRKTVRRESDLKRHLSLKNLGGVPLVRMKRRSNRKGQHVLFEASNSDSAFDESISAIRHRVEKALTPMEEEQDITPSNSARVIVVTSSMAGEGKTTMAANLAVALAKKNNSVILLDGDLRNPSVGKVFGIQSEGMSMVRLLEHPDIEKLNGFVYRKLPLMVLPGNDKVKEFHGLDENQVKRALEALRPLCDYIIIDTPPIGLVSDASIFARCSDASILVVRQDYSPIDLIIGAAESLSESGSKLLGYIINGVSVGITGYHSSYGYGYGYGYGGRYGSRYGSSGKYGYGYGEPKEERRKRKRQEEEDAMESQSIDKISFIRR